MTDMQLSFINDRKYILKMTIPIFIELFLNILVGMVAQYMISNYSQSAVTAIGNSNLIMNLIIITFNVISMATTILVSQHIGRNRPDALPRLYTLSLVSNFCIGLLLSIVIVVFHPQIFSLINTPEVAMEEASNYITIVAGFIFVHALYMTLSAIFKSNNMMRYTMVISIVINIVNVILNGLLIYGVGPIPALGATGAGIAASASRGVALIIAIIIFIKKIRVKLTFKHLIPFPKKLFKNLMSLGLPAGGESMSYNMTQIVMMSYINNFGTWVVNTRFFVTTFAQFSSVFLSAISSVIQIIVGYLIGAREYDNANKRVFSTLRTALIISFTVSSILFLSSDFLFSLVTSDPNIINLGKKVMFIEIFIGLGRATNMVLVRSLQAAGDAKFPVVIGIIHMWGVAVLGGFILGHLLGLGLVGVWIAMACDEHIRAIIFIFRWKGGKWRRKATMYE